MFRYISFLLMVFASSLYANFDRKNPLLGYAYDEDTEQVLSQVLVSKSESPILYSGVQEGSSQIKFDLSFEEILAELDVKTDASLDLGIFSIKGAADFVSTIAKSEMSNNLVYTYEVQGKSAILNQPSLTDIALMIIKSRHSENKAKFFGDAFISQVNLGGKLVAAISIHFANKEAKSAFHAKFKMDLLEFLKANAEGGVKNDQLSASASINISVKQIGGDPTKLSHVLGSSSEGFPVVRCNLKTLKPCVEAMEKIFEYGKDFGKQLKNMEYDPCSSKGAAILSSIKSSYDSYGFVEVGQGAHESFLEEIKERRESLAKHYLNYSRDRKRIEKLFDLQPSSFERRRLEVLRDEINRSIESLLFAMDTCYERPGDCLEKANKLHLHRYEPKEISFEWTFYNYCEFVKDSQSILNTVQRVRQNFPDGEDLSCSDLEEKLGKLKRLNLSYDPEKRTRKISDLRPLVGLPKLRQIILDNNDIHSLSPLKSNRNLRFIVAKNNKLSEFPDLCEFPNLNHLDLEFNRLIEIEGSYDVEDCIEHSNALRFLNVRGVYFDTEEGRKEFIETLEGHTQVKRYKNLFTSNEDICEKHVLDLIDKGICDNSDLDFYRRRGKIIDQFGIGVSCNDRVTLKYEDIYMEEQ